jgi:sulfate/thiosulfate transport system substrate-binding protein
MRMSLAPGPWRLATLFFCALFAAGCGSSDREGRVRLILAAYTTPREAYGRAIIPAFQRHWREKTGQEVEFRESYQASGAQARAIIGGFEADIAALSLSEDVERIVEAGLIRPGWKDSPYSGIVSTSIVVIAVRPGNPKDIRDWADLARAGINVLTPDPRTSGGAMWNINALYGAALRGYAGVPPDNPHDSADFLGRVFRNVSIMDKGARESITNFEKGVGDAALTYENEVLVGRQAGQRYEYVIPRSTILIENPVAIVDETVDRRGVREVAEAFVNFLWSAEAQRMYAEYGLRPVDERVIREVEDRYPAVEDLWTIEYLGGWKRVLAEVYGPQGVYTRMFQDLHRRR